MMNFSEFFIFNSQLSIFFPIFASATVPKGLIGNIVKTDNSPRCCKF